MTFNDAKLGLGGANLIFAGAKWIKGRISFKGADCEAMTVDLKEPDVRLGKIDFRGANGTPRIIPTNPGPPLVVEGGPADAVTAAKTSGHLRRPQASSSSQHRSDRSGARL
ncbi:MAG: hypothetical protein ACRDTA_02025 [Pseudonocardiaceae bacterium]